MEKTGITNEITEAKRVKFYEQDQRISLFST